MNRITTDTLLRNELFRKSEFSGNSVVIPYTSEGALARMKKLEVIETRQEKREGYNLFNIDTVTNHFLNSETGAVAASNSWRLSDFIEVKAMADYLFSWTSSSSYFQVTIAMYDENKIFLNGLEYGISNIYKKVFQTIENCKYVKIAYAVRINSTDVTRENIMLAEGTEEKPYEPFGVMPSLDYPSEIEHIGDNIQLFDKDTISANKYINLGNGALGNSTTSSTSYSEFGQGSVENCVNKTHILQIQRKMLKGDYFDIANKKEVHKWDEVILTGDENISMSNSQNVNYFGINSITLEDFEYIDDNTTNYMCTHFNAIKVSERYKYNTMFINSAKRIVLCCNEFSNVDDFKVKLAELYNEGKAVEIYYKLATPLELDCTEEQIAVLKELENMTTYADKTIIAIDNDLSEMTLEVEQSRISMIEEKLKKEETV